MSRRNAGFSGNNSTASMLKCNSGLEWAGMSVFVSVCGIHIVTIPGVSEGKSNRDYKLNYLFIGKVLHRLLSGRNLRLQTQTKLTPAKTVTTPL